MSRFTIDVNFYDAPFEEAQHPRGQPKNKGEFVAKGASQASGSGHAGRTGGGAAQGLSQPYARATAKNAGRTLGVPVKASFSPSPATKQRYQQIGVTPIDLHEVTGSAGLFRQAISEATAASKAGAAVHIYDEAEYKGMRLFLTADKHAGFALKSDDIVSVFKHPGASYKGAANAMLDLAVQQGGKRLDCFDTVLPKMYSRSGFAAVARVKFSDEFAPDGWDYNGMKPFNNGRPDVVFMALVRGAPLYQTGDGRMLADYDEAVAEQLAKVKKGV